MAINKVVFGGTTLIDISDTTATASKILSGYTAYNKAGVKISGTATAGMQVATGSFTGTATTHTISVSGLNFTPQGCAYVLLESPGSNTNAMLCGSTEAVSKSSSGSDIHAVRRNGSSSFIVITGAPTLTSNGFTHTNSTGNFGGNYWYIVWG